MCVNLEYQRTKFYPFENVLSLLMIHFCVLKAFGVQKIRSRAYLNRIKILYKARRGATAFVVVFAAIFYDVVVVVIEEK